MYEAENERERYDIDLALIPQYVDQQDKFSYSFKKCCHLERDAYVLENCSLKRCHSLINIGCGRANEAAVALKSEWILSLSPTVDVFAENILFYSPSFFSFSFWMDIVLRPWKCERRGL